MCPDHHFNPDGTHKENSCVNVDWERNILLACLDPNHWEVTADCQPIVSCAHSNCEQTCVLCYNKLSCNVLEHVHDLETCDFSRCEAEHHGSDCLERVLICEKEQRQCHLENCPDLEVGDVELGEAKLDGDGLSVWLYNTTPEVVTVVICAAYDQNGKMLDVQMELVQADQNKELRAQQIHFACSQWTEETSYYRLFAVEQGSIRPRTEVKTVFVEERD